jgi:hypothetical protein
MRLFLLGSSLLAGLLWSGCNSACCQDVALVESAPSPVGEKGNMTPIPVITGLPSKAPCGITLSASATDSSDPDGSIVKYSWKLDGVVLTGNENAVTTLPCDGKNHQVCLTVTDNKGASQTTCQTVTVDNAKPEPKPADSCNIVPVITYEKADSLQYKFYCTDSTYNGKKIDEATAAECTWVAKKYFKNGDSDSHGQTGPVKWINVDPDIFKAMDLTLTVKNDDCEATVTKHYFIPADLPY